MTTYGQRKTFHTIVYTPVGINEPETFTKGVNTETQKILIRAMWRVVLLLEASAKTEAPVDTGWLKNNITSAVDGRVSDTTVRGTVGTYKSVFYAGWVHDGHMAWGTVYIPENPFLARAYYKSKKIIHAIFAKAGITEVQAAVGKKFGKHRKEEGLL